ncbi:hypothetical protein [Mycolicibacterium sp. CH28]|nr:hypothetical protein [Mycolicibacterium sp. CH28]
MSDEQRSGAAEVVGGSYGDVVVAEVDFRWASGVNAFYLDPTAAR